MAAHSSILAWKNSMDRRAWWATFQRVEKSRHDWAIRHRLVLKTNSRYVISSINISASIPKIGVDFENIAMMTLFYVLSYFSCIRLCDPMDCSPPGSSVHGILQTRIQEWVAMPFCRGSSLARDQTLVSMSSTLAGMLPLAPPGKPLFYFKI